MAEIGRAKVMDLARADQSEVLPSPWKIVEMGFCWSQE